MTPELQEKIAKSRADLDPKLNFLKDHPLDFNDMERKISNDEWFKDFHRFHTVYKTLDTWDEHQLRVYMMVPKKLKTTNGTPILFQCLWHGGGLTTGGIGGADHKNGEWWSHWFPDYKRTMQIKSNAITFIPINACEDWIKKCLNDKKMDDGANICRDRLLISGESAGALLAIYSWLTGKENLKINALLLHYSMLEYYARNLPENEKCKFMGADIFPDDVLIGAKDLIAKVEELRNEGRLPARSDTPPPEGMHAAFGLSVTKLWEPVYRHGDRSSDALDRLSEQRSEPNFFPKLFMFHGEEDTNCPIENVHKFLKILKAKGWSKMPDPVFERVAGKPHAFDYNIPYPEGVDPKDNNGEDAKWLQRILVDLEKWWAAP
ncbi:hypothetical protein CC80DRAFT_502972 [Byssothecium circinans]|uniref:Alpha/beta-hydrolase n=1 Tax=Byssothecium circinans TaxID=147558 RepID=A0A6A5U1M3_9PLEO|nr:hypothetical protein CC80DRAFT_502972 [Byssothecium circinans]